MNEMSSSALLDIQLILLCVCGVDSFLPKLEYLRKTFSRSLFQKEGFEIWGCSFVSELHPEVNFLHREKHSRRSYLDYLKNIAKSADMAVLELTFKNVSLGKWSKN